ncbi:TIR domain-containing protein [Variovorax sp. YR216]|uniref:TIR domain-containing protein n=1 Tax=Variovorax sp. YR216 TaxID=1882828 RepID=UPI00089CD33D|nr:TIR domain-containing protein [Variovorax sp. YR216]SEA68872.1 Predicted nucleotide-binding protein containing TIR-like domain-containing protein [Variovorax sp. YR216]
MQDTPNDVFVGSSSDFLAKNKHFVPLLKEILSKAELDPPLNVNLWGDWFEGHVGAEIYQTLDLAAKTSEWAILVFSQDDLRQTVAESLKKVEDAKTQRTKVTVRDNVLFELGLFYGHIGTKRVFILEQVAKGEASHVADDIRGIQRLPFSDRKSLEAALHRIVALIKERSADFPPRWAPASSLAIGYYEQAIKPFVERRREHEAKLGPFVVELLVPHNSFHGLDIANVRHVFGAACEQTDPAGGTDGRPMLWAFKGRRDLYFDIPTTLLTAERVIDAYMNGTATATEKERMYRSQANAFANVVRARSKAFGEVRVVDRRDIDEIRSYLESKRRSGG